MGKKKIYRCSYCRKQFDNSAKADSCRIAHNLLYLEISKADLNQLLQFVYTGSQSLITETLLATLRKAQFGRGK